MRLVRYRCSHCGRTWTPRQEQPKQCPGCNCRFTTKTGVTSRNRYEVIE